MKTTKEAFKTLLEYAEKYRSCVHDSTGNLDFRLTIVMLVHLIVDILDAADESQRQVIYDILVEEGIDVKHVIGE